MDVIVHGGAGGGPTEPEARQGILDEAVDAGSNAETPIDAVEAAVRHLESSPRFNAGVGSAVQADGIIRTDAGIMTSGREAGAACSMAGVEHAVSVARVVLEETPHVLVAGEGAVDLADAFGIETGVDLWTDSSRARWADLDPPQSTGEQLVWVREQFAGADGHDTVGAVAHDGGTFAAATSTGGRRFALAGRVGDVPQIGSGFYAVPAGAASATGAGEDIATVTLSRRAVQHLERGITAEDAAELAIAEFAELTGSDAGVIVLGRDGAGSAYNTEAMQTATA